MQKSNFHTHTKYSDGNDTPAEMIESAISAGFTALGFSDHSYTHADESYTMSRAGEREYFKEIRELAERYAGSIRIYCGVEQDGESCLPDYDYDYIISSVHELIRHGMCYSIDSNADKYRFMVESGYGGSYTDMAKAYFERLTEHVIRQKTDIVGHFDLVTKYSLAPEADPAYIDAAISAVREIMKHCDVFELNTGAIARGLRTTPYPAEFILGEIKRLGGGVIMTSDCHYRHKLTAWFEEGEKYLTAHGFTKNDRSVLNSKVWDIEIWR